MVGTVPSGSCLQSVRAEPQPTIMKPTATSSGSTARCLQGRHASFWRHGEIYRKGRRPSLGQASTRPSAQPFDEFPVGYSWASCSPAELASASPTASYFAAIGQNRRERAAHKSSASPPRAGRRENISLSGQGEVFFLDIPSYRTRLAYPHAQKRSRCLENGFARCSRTDSTCA